MLAEYADAGHNIWGLVWDQLAQTPTTKQLKGAIKACRICPRPGPLSEDMSSMAPTRLPPALSLPSPEERAPAPAPALCSASSPTCCSSSSCPLGGPKVWALSLKCTSRAGGGWDACGVHGLGLVLRAPGAVETPPGGAVPGVLQGPGPGHRGAVQRGGHSGEPFFPQTSPWKPAFLVSLPWLLLLLLLLGAAYYTQREHSAQMRELLLRALHAGLRSGTYRQRRRL
ncbi:uncharacterized protein LOC119252288 isoform X2 [Talpa occidentalis]|uniref:uncharacterized protein LOC119252288 isoform X2 n=1 Tax=Talpa occidentalis TaxID=50954 RepID=UPI0023F76F16|nr:uncharacterized protein LOC119252288 isoform X2 [Talpa occidentalis]XP_054554666.1 uncharacterized protein LOC119252288 isoform X2 [Talpa occidentalis]XP_054554667.1 uncharacterized protein LOC119252288 isoform X2 [Talpa occidentalis]XP_054554668.1 uncharacterized protein LOC119252288 isoform X2 [Talpa occidentalis]XP_054554669.1 uncharacterized protein LOC119252288 isoform X2 [Talpa occidentalis]XP_054554670.1 uncharacterized protein LOC119252288 isoform X2 [Talpa occidentalis]